MNFIASKHHFLAQQSISDNKNWDEIFSDNIFFIRNFNEVVQSSLPTKKKNHTA